MHKPSRCTYAEPDRRVGSVPGSEGIASNAQLKRVRATFFGDRAPARSLFLGAGLEQCDARIDLLRAQSRARIFFAVLDPVVAGHRRGVTWRCCSSRTSASSRRGRSASCCSRTWWPGDAARAGLRGGRRPLVAPHVRRGRRPDAGGGVHRHRPRGRLRPDRGARAPGGRRAPRCSRRPRWPPCRASSAGSGCAAATSLYGAITDFGFTAGPALAALRARWSSAPRACWSLNGATFAVSAVVLVAARLRARPGGAEAGEEPPSLLAEPREGLRAAPGCAASARARSPRPGRSSSEACSTWPSCCSSTEDAGGSDRGFGVSGASRPRVHRRGSLARRRRAARPTLREPLPAGPVRDGRRLPRRPALAPGMRRCCS